MNGNEVEVYTDGYPPLFSRRYMVVKDLEWTSDDSKSRRPMWQFPSALVLQVNGQWSGYLVNCNEDRYQPYSRYSAEEYNEIIRTFSEQFKTKFRVPVVNYVLSKKMNR